MGKLNADSCKLEAHILSNPKGHFVYITEYLFNGRMAPICILESNENSAWALYEHHLQRHFSHLGVAFSFKTLLLTYICTAVLMTSHLTPSPSTSQMPFDTHKPPTLYRIPDVKPWSNSNETLKHFSYVDIPE